MKSVIITGASGLFGEILKKSMLEKGFSIVNVDLEKDDVKHLNLVSYQGT